MTGDMRRGLGLEKWVPGVSSNEPRREGTMAWHEAEG